MSVQDYPPERQGMTLLSRRDALIGLGVGIVTGALVALIAAYRIVWDEAAASLVFAPIVGLVLFITAYRVARRDGPRAGIFTALLAGVIAAIIGSLADNYLAHTFIDIYVKNTNASVNLPTSVLGPVTAEELLAREPGNIALGVVATLLASGLLGALGALAGAGSGGAVSKEAARRAQAEAGLPYEYGARSPDEMPGDDPRRVERVGQGHGHYAPLQNEGPPPGTL